MAKKVTPRLRLTGEELLAMSRMLRLYLNDDRFFNPLVAVETKRIAAEAMQKIESWR